MIQYPLTAEEKIRLSLTGNPFTDPVFQHEGPDVVRWIRGGNAPTVRVTFEQKGDATVARCPECGKSHGWFHSDYAPGTYSQIAAIREEAALHEHK